MVKPMNGIAGLEFGKSQDNTNDAFGDACEYLVGMDAAGFFTPQEVPGAAKISRQSPAACTAMMRFLVPSSDDYDAPGFLYAFMQRTRAVRTNRLHLPR